MPRSPSTSRARRSGSNLERRCGSAQGSATWRTPRAGRPPGADGPSARSWARTGPGAAKPSPRRDHRRPARACAPGRASGHPWRDRLPRRPPGRRPATRGAVPAKAPRSPTAGGTARYHEWPSPPAPSGARVRTSLPRPRAAPRGVPSGVPSLLIDELAGHLAAHLSGAAPEDLVFTSPGGGLRRYLAERVFNPAVERAGLDQALTFHGLRRVAASLMVEQGEHARVIQGRLGHATARLSMELYAHVPEAADRDVATNLDARWKARVGRHLQRAQIGHVAGTTTARRAPPTNKRPVQMGWGGVEVTGFEPATSTMRT